MKRLTIALLALATLALLAAAYAFSFGVPLESACHMEDADACARLAQTIRLSRDLALLALALVLCVPIGRLAARRMAAGARRLPPS